MNVVWECRRRWARGGLVVDQCFTLMAPRTSTVVQSVCRAAATRNAVRSRLRYLGVHAAIKLSHIKTCQAAAVPQRQGRLYSLAPNSGNDCCASARHATGALLAALHTLATTQQSHLLHISGSARSKPRRAAASPRRAPTSRAGAPCRPAPAGSRCGSGSRSR